MTYASNDVDTDCAGDKKPTIKFIISTVLEMVFYRHKKSRKVKMKPKMFKWLS
jgi:hypothetical protein